MQKWQRVMTITGGGMRWVSSHMPADLLPECEYIPSSKSQTFTTVPHEDHSGIMHIKVCVY